MKIRNKFFITILCLIVFCAWTSNQMDDIKQAEWLIGTWENKTQRGSVYETWNKVSNIELAGKSYIVKEKDTIVFENVKLIQIQDTLFCIPTVKNQNDGLPVRFAIKIISNTQLVFENRQHDFPQIISYTKINTDSLVAQISGIKNGQERKQLFPMKRVK